MSSNLPARAPRPPSRPLTAEHEGWAVEQLAPALRSVQDMLKDGGVERFKEQMKARLRHGDLRFTILVVEAANKDDYLADAALREVGAELQFVEKRDWQLGHPQILAYCQRALNRAPLRRKPGRDGYDLADRKIAICVLIMWACAWFCVAPTRNRESRRGGRRPSGCSLTAAALERHGIHIEEGTIQEHIWKGALGTMVRKIVGDGLWRVQF